MPTVIRRCISITVLMVLLCFTWFALPLWLSASLLIDLYRWKRRFPITRFMIAMGAIVTCEFIGICISVVLPITLTLFWREDRRKLYRASNVLLQLYWAESIFRVIKLIYRLKVKIINKDDIKDTPMIVLLRHSSIADVLLSNHLIAYPMRMALRYVIKNELRWDPCLDIVGPRLNCLFVDRTSVDSQAEIEKVGALARNLGLKDGVTLYPEGTRFTQEKRQKLLDKLRTNNKKELYDYASSLKHVLPPRLGGVMALLQQNSNADVIFCAHTGFEGMSKLNHFIDGKVIGKTINVWFWRVPFKQIPKNPLERQSWLLQQWKLMDERVGKLAQH